MIKEFVTFAIRRNRAIVSMSFYMQLTTKSNNNK